MREQLSSISNHHFDVVVIGGGINGSVSAAALASAGLNVLLVEQSDFASFTSQESSNMVWGGIKYLQSLEFALVYKLCRSRAKLMKNYPNRIKPVGFLATIDENAPASLLAIWFGSWLYWLIGLFSTSMPKVRDRAMSVSYEPALAGQRFGGSVQYFDGLLLDNDARFVWDFIAKARGFGATVRNYVRVNSGKFEDGVWQLQLLDTNPRVAASDRANVTHSSLVEVTSGAVINAAGPFASVLNQQLGSDPGARLVLSKGIHLVVPKITKDDRVLAFWDEEGRLFYVLPMHDRSVIGTTDTRVSDPFTQVSDDDRDFVLRQINRSLNLSTPLNKQDIIAERCGVRPLVASSRRQQKNSDQVDWHKMSRKHVVTVDPARKLVSIFGGKLTDCLNVGEEIRAEMRHLGFSVSKQKWFGEDQISRKKAKLALAQLVQHFREKTGGELWSESLARGLFRRHGVAALKIASEAKSEDLAPVFEGLDFSFAELAFIANNELVVTADDLLRRRTPLAIVRSHSNISANQKLQDLIEGLG